MEDNPIEKLAIAAALENDWEQAVKLNKQILAENPKDADALNRLARACSELGDTEKAKECYYQVLKIDPANSITIKNLKLLTKSANGAGLSGNGKSGNNGKKNLSLDIFLTEPGRTKLVNLVNLAPPAILSNLSCGEKSTMVFKKHQVLIETCQGEYLGAVPDDLSHYLISLTKLGNDYEAYIKAVKTNTLTVVIWEKRRSPRFANQPSFLGKKQITRPLKSTSEAGFPAIEFDESFAESQDS